MNIWVVASTYDSELYASTHLTRKGAFLRAVMEMYSCMNIDQYDTIEEYWEECGLTEDDDKPEWCPYDLEKLRAMSADQLSDQFGEMIECYWETHDWGDRVELEVLATTVVG